VLQPVKQGLRCLRYVKHLMFARNLELARQLRCPLPERCLVQLICSRCANERALASCPHLWGASHSLPISTM